MRTHYRILLFIPLLIAGFLQLQAQPIQLRIPDTTVVVGDTLDLPVYASQILTEDSILSWQLEIEFDAVELEALGIEKLGTLSSMWSSIQVNTGLPGQVHIAAAGGTPLSGTGKLILIRFRCFKAGYANVRFTDPSENLLNESDTLANLDDGSVRIDPKPVITVRPETGLLVSGEQLQFSVQDGTAPYNWSITLDSVGSVNGEGLFTAATRGFTRVVAEDSEGIIDTSGLIEVRGLELSIPGTSGWQANPVSIPINATDLSALGIIAGELTLKYPVNVVEKIQQVVTAGSLLEGMGDIQINTTIPGEVSISFAGNTALTGSGPLCWLNFLVSRNTGGGYFEIEEAVFNQDILARHVRGYFTIDPLPDLTVVPQTASLLAGETLTFTASGGSPPYSWSVSNPGIAGIDASGVMTALSGGTVFVSVTDQIGAEGASGGISIYDTRILIPDTTVELNTTLDLPVTLSQWPASATGITSIEATITCKHPELELLGIETAGSLTEDWYEEHMVDFDSVLHVAMAGSGGFSDSGNLFFLQVQLTEELVDMEEAQVRIEQIIFNEGLPGVLPDTGIIRGNLIEEDLALSHSTNLANDCELPVPLEFNLTITNQGDASYETGDTLHAILLLPEEPPVTAYGIIATPLPPGGSIDLHYLDTFDQSFTGSFEYIIYTDLEEDVNRANDTVGGSVTIYGYPEVDLGDAEVEVSAFPYMLDAGAGFETYEWHDGSTSQTYSATEHGQKWVTVTMQGCPGSDTILLTAPVGIGPPSRPEDELMVLPNPSNGVFRVSAANIQGWAEIELFNVLGKRIYRRRIYCSNQLDHMIRLEDPVKGPCLLKVNQKIRKVMIR